MDENTSREQLIEGLMAIGEVLTPISDFVIGYRKNLIQGGFDPAIATIMASEVHNHVVHMILAGVMDAQRTDADDE